MGLKEFTYRNASEIVSAIELEPDPVRKMAIIWANHKNNDLRQVMRLLYDRSVAVEAYNLPVRRNKETQITEQLGRSIEKILAFNEQLRTPNQKYRQISKFLEQFSGTNEQLFRALVRGDIELDLDLADVRRAYPEIPDRPVINKDVEKIDAENSSSVKVSDNGIPIHVITTGEKSYQFFTDGGHALVLPNKINSVFRDFFEDAKLMVFQAHFFALSKKKDKRLTLSASEKMFEVFKKGSWPDESEPFEIEIYDAVPLVEFRYQDTLRRFDYLTRRRWLNNYFKEHDVPQVALAPQSKYNETAKKGFVYGNKSYWRDGYTKL